MADLNSMTDRLIDQSYLCQSFESSSLFTVDSIDLHEDNESKGQGKGIKNILLFYHTESQIGFVIEIKTVFEKS